MESVQTPNRYWKDIKSVESAVELIQSGILLQWKDMRVLKKTFSEDEQAVIIKHFAKHLADCVSHRLSCEIIVESLLIWIANALEQKLVASFLMQIIEDENYEQICRAFVEISLTSEVSESAHDEEIYAIAVLLVCELGIALSEFDLRSSQKLRASRAVLDHIATYLLSVSNHNSSCIRLSLFHYFGYSCVQHHNDLAFNRILNRFGHTALDHLFSRLFDKRSEAVALQFLLENLPFVLHADAHCQRILHETFKYYMLKKPERFSLFLQTFIDHFLEIDGLSPSALQTMQQHLGALYKVASEVNHNSLGREVVAALQKFEHDAYQHELLQQILDDAAIRSSFKELVKNITSSRGALPIKDFAAHLRAAKRGRKPAFSRVEGVSTLGQVIFLGGFELAKAS